MSEHDEISGAGAVIDWENVPTVTSAELAFAAGVGGAAAALKGPTPNPENFGVNIDLGDSVARVRFTDRPMNRLMVAIRKHLGEGERHKFMPIMLRLMALCDLFEDSRMENYARPKPGDPEVQEAHQAVFEVAATMPLSARKGFNRQRFFRKVRGVATQLDARE